LKGAKEDFLHNPGRRGGGGVPVRNRAPGRYTAGARVPRAEAAKRLAFDSHSHFDYKYFDFGRHFTLPSQLLQRFVRILA